MLLAIPTWRDPLNFLTHDLYERIQNTGYHQRLGYKTGCGLKLVIGDVNKTNLVNEEPTCLACIVASNHIPTEE